MKQNVVLPKRLPMCCQYICFSIFSDVVSHGKTVFITKKSKISQTVSEGASFKLSSCVH